MKFMLSFNEVKNPYGGSLSFSQICIGKMCIASLIAKLIVIELDTLGSF